MKGVSSEYTHFFSITAPYSDTIVDPVELGAKVVQELDSLNEWNFSAESKENVREILSNAGKISVKAKDDDRVLDIYTMRSLDRTKLENTLYVKLSFLGYIEAAAIEEAYLKDDKIIYKTNGSGSAVLLYPDFRYASLVAGSQCIVSAILRC